MHTAPDILPNYCDRSCPGQSVNKERDTASLAWACEGSINCTSTILRYRRCWSITLPDNALASCAVQKEMCGTWTPHLLHAYLKRVSVRVVYERCLSLQYPALSYLQRSQSTNQQLRFCINIPALLCRSRLGFNRQISWCWKCFMKTTATTWHKAGQICISGLEREKRMNG